MAELKQINKNSFRRTESAKNGTLLITHRKNGYQTAYLIIKSNGVGYMLMNMSSYYISAQAETIEELIEWFLSKQDGFPNPITDIFFSNDYHIIVNENKIFDWENLINHDD